MNFFDPRQTENGESGKRITYRNTVFEQCKLADELHISFRDSEYMSYLDRKYALKYLEEKAKAFKDKLDSTNDKKKLR